MALDYWLGGVLSVLLGAYLVYAMLRPEQL